MTSPQKPQEYGLTELPVEPTAVPACSACLGICVRRSNARSGGDYSAASDANVDLRRHQAEVHPA